MDSGPRSTNEKLKEFEKVKKDLDDTTRQLDSMIADLQRSLQQLNGSSNPSSQSPPRER